MTIDELTRWRSEFPILHTTTYLNSNSLGAMPHGVFDAMHAYADVWATRGVRAWGEGWWDMPVTVGDDIAKLIGAAQGSVTVHQNVTIASMVALSCLRCTPQRNVIVMTDMDFPSVMYLHRQMADMMGAELRIVHSDDGITINQDKLLSAIDERVALVATSHVLFKSAFVNDAAAIVQRAHAVGALIALDGFHSAGVIPVDVAALDADFYTGGVLKWLCGGPGGAFLYVKPLLAKTLQPRFTGWQAHAHPFAFETDMDYADSPFRFLTGTAAVPCLYAAQPGLKIINAVGAQAIRAKSVRQVAALVERASERGWRVNTPMQAERRGGTVTVDLGDGAQLSGLTQAVGLELKRREVIIDFRAGAGIRISPHFYTTDDECEHAVREIDDILRTKAYEPHLATREVVT